MVVTDYFSLYMYVRQNSSKMSADTYPSRYGVFYKCHLIKMAINLPGMTM